MSGAIGLFLVFMYLQFFPNQRKDNSLALFSLGVVLILVTIVTGLADVWIIDELMLALSFIFGGQEISKNILQSLQQVE